MKGFIIGPYELAIGVGVLAIILVLLLILSTTYAGIPGLEGLNELLGREKTSADIQKLRQTTEVGNEMFTNLGETGSVVPEKEKCENDWKGEFCPVNKPCPEDWGILMGDSITCCPKKEDGGSRCGESSASQSPAESGVNEGKTGTISLADDEGVGDVVSGGARLDCPKVKSHAQIEYEEDGGSKNIIFVFYIPFKQNGFPDLQNAEWKWRGEDTEVVWDFQPLGEFSNHRSEYPDNVFQEIANRLADANANYTFMRKYYEGIKIFEDILNTDDWAHNDDYIILHYPDGRRFVTNTDSYDAFCLSDKVNSTTLDFIRYEEDGWVPNIDYGYIDGEWKWKNETEDVFRPLGKFKGEYEKTIHSDPAFVWLRDELIKMNNLAKTDNTVNAFERGLSVFEKATLKGGDFSDDHLWIYYRNGSVFPSKSTEQEDVYCLRNLVHADTGAGNCISYNWEMPDMVNEYGVHKIKLLGAELMIADQPQYLYYWQHLQREQVTWESKLSWKVHALIDFSTDFLIGAAGPKLVLKPVTVSGKVMTTAFVTSILSKATLTYIKYRGITFATNKFLEALSNEIIKLTQIKEPNSMIMYASWIDGGQETTELPGSSRGTPVVVWWDEGFSSWETADAFHLASPCYIDYLRGYQKYDVICEKYEYNAKTDYTYCYKPSVEEESTPHYLADDAECTLSLRGVSDYYLELDDSRVDTNPISVLMEEEVEDVIDHIKRGNNYNYEIYKNTENSIIPVTNRVADMIKIEYGSKTEYIVDAGGEIDFDTFVVENCRIPGIVVSDIHKKDTGDEYNYCLNQEGWGHTVLKVGGIAVLVGGVVATVIITGGTAAPAWVAFVVSLGSGAAAGALEATGDYYEQQGDWPGAEGPNLDISP